MYPTSYRYPTSDLMRVSSNGNWVNAPRPPIRVVNEAPAPSPVPIVNPPIVAPQPVPVSTILPVLGPNIPATVLPSPTATQALPPASTSTASSGGSSISPSQPVSVTVSPTGADPYQSLLDWLTQQTLITGYPNWLIGVGVGLLGWYLVTPKKGGR